MFTSNSVNSTSLCHVNTNWVWFWITTPGVRCSHGKVFPDNCLLPGLCGLSWWQGIHITKVSPPSAADLINGKGGARRDACTPTTGCHLLPGVPFLDNHWGCNLKLTYLEESSVGYNGNFWTNIGKIVCGMNCIQFYKPWIVPHCSLHDRRRCP